MYTLKDLGVEYDFDKSLTENFRAVIEEMGNTPEIRAAVVLSGILNVHLLGNKEDDRKLFFDVILSLYGNSDRKLDEDTAHFVRLAILKKEENNAKDS